MTTSGVGGTGEVRRTGKEGGRRLRGSEQGWRGVVEGEMRRMGRRVSGTGGRGEELGYEAGVKMRLGGDE